MPLYSRHSPQVLRQHQTWHCALCALCIVACRRTVRFQTIPACSYEMHGIPNHTAVVGFLACSEPTGGRLRFQGGFRVGHCAKQRAAASKPRPAPQLQAAAPPPRARRGAAPRVALRCRGHARDSPHSARSAWGAGCRAGPDGRRCRRT